MSDQPLDYQAVRSALVDNDRGQLRRVNAKLHRIVAGMLGKHSPDVLDILQNAMIRVICGFKDFDPNDVGTIAAWLNKIATNVTIDHCRSSKRYKSLFCDDDDADMEDCGHGEHQTLERVHNKRLLLEALDVLDVKFRAVLVLRLFEEYSIKEIAVALDIKDGTVKSRLSRAEKMIRAYIATRDLMRRQVTELAPDPIKRLGT